MNVVIVAHGRKSPESGAEWIRLMPGKIVGTKRTWYFTRVNGLSCNLASDIGIKPRLLWGIPQVDPLWRLRLCLVMINTAAKIFGLVFILIGILGFVPGVTNEHGMLLGLFHVNTAHNIVHLVSGALALMAGFMGGARVYFQIFGVIYGLVAILGMFSSGPIFGIIANNVHDVWLHFLISAGALFLGFYRERQPAHA
jgi:hypothetical protein